MSMSEHLENNLLNHVLNNTAYTPPASVYVTLFTADPTKAFVTANEVSTTVDDTAYTRQAVTHTTASGTSGTVTNTNAQTFAAVVYGSGATPYMVTHYGYCDALTDGNLLFSAPITGTGIVRSTGVALTFDIGQLSAVMA